MYAVLCGAAKEIFSSTSNLFEFGKNGPIE